MRRRGLTDTKRRPPNARRTKTHTVRGGEDRPCAGQEGRAFASGHDFDQGAQDDVERRAGCRRDHLEKPFVGAFGSCHDQRNGRAVHFDPTGLFALPVGGTCGQTTMQRGEWVAQALRVLGLESSCDDSAAAILRRSPDGSVEILSSVVKSQTNLHAAFGGVVPEIAARAHAEILDICVEEALAQANLPLAEVDALAVTAGPGLIGGVVSGVMLAKGISAATGKPLYGINHLAGHALTPRLTHGTAYPYLMLLISGGHCQFLVVKSADSFERLGGTIDDAPGEAFDKIARLLGLDQPGGPAVEICARSGNPARFPLPRPLLDRDGCDLSFSGLKTAVLRLRDRVVEETGGLRLSDRADICAAFQASVTDVLAEKTRRALTIYAAEKPQTATFCVAGGVAANASIRAALETVSAEMGADFVAPPLALCTDNAAMIAYAAMEQMTTRAPDDMTLSARPRWPLDQSSPAMLGGGKKGAKA